MAYRVATVSDIGIKRKVNQDSICCKACETKKGTALMAVVCDGMGGLSEGEVASRMVSGSFEKWFLQVFVAMANKNEEIDEVLLQQELNKLVLQQNDELVAYGESREIQVGTTASAVFLVGGRYFTVHVGDSRIYGMTDKLLLQLTNDHSVVADEVRRGVITEEQARTDKRRNILMQCVGVRKGVAPEFSDGSIEGNVSFLLCSDGFVHKISGREIWENCNPIEADRTEKMERVLNDIVETLKSRHETDNISAILLRADRKKGGIVE